MTRLLTTGRVLAILTIVLGLVHEAMTFHPMIADGFTGLDTAWRQAFTYFSLGCGGLLLLCGILFLMLLGQVGRHEFLVTPLVTTGVFAAANGVLATCFMFDNPFAWTVLAVGMGLFVVAVAIRAQHRKR